eukprot:scaffold120050_cov37-Phaeocystis_antarctica.AAC.1
MCLCPSCAGCSHAHAEVSCSRSVEGAPCSSCRGWACGQTLTLTLTLALALALALALTLSLSLTLTLTRWAVGFVTFSLWAVVDDTSSTWLGLGLADPNPNANPGPNPNPHPNPNPNPNQVDDTSSRTQFKQGVEALLWIVGTATTSRLGLAADLTPSLTLPRHRSPLTTHLSFTVAVTAPRSLLTFHPQPKPSP